MRPSPLNPAGADHRIRPPRAKLRPRAPETGTRRWHALLRRIALVVTVPELRCSGKLCDLCTQMVGRGVDRDVIVHMFDAAAPGRLRPPPAGARPPQTPEHVGWCDHLRRPHAAPGLPPMIPRRSRALRCGCADH